ncbi:hypothetical protein QGX11_gp122 [Pseudomonas phage PPSC2]|uniref:Uncharacterized protein n=1 Tax=Pseudomonas phage PPSC2 TaxID=2041350 RepID=A0A2R2YAU3_9CAUD|nr:hypothetical protein QGX11_gp122 [Pseudomonas phage PPSC2]ATN92885.1 hypothetical protein PPSC2_122 [Pseudomonas phage PPSC2]
MFKTFKKWLASDGKPHHTKALPSRETLEEQDAHMVGEPVTSFIASLAREPKRYKIERVLTLDEFPKYTAYHWMHSGAGSWKFTDTKTGLTLGAYVHEQGRVYAVYGLPFDLNHWELKAIYTAFYKGRHKAEERKERMRQSAWERARKFKEEREKIDRLAFAKQFQEG